MSFPRAAIRRFNEPADTSIPPIGSYDPKFVTDVAVSSTMKKAGFIDKWGRVISNNNVLFGSGISVTAGAPLGAAGVISLRSRSSSVGARRGSMTRTASSAGGEYSEPRLTTSRVSFASSVASGRIGRNPSTGKLTRRRSSTVGIVRAISPVENNMMMRRKSSTRLARGFSKSKLQRTHSPTSQMNFCALRRAPSTTCTFAMCSPQQAFAETLRETLKNEGAFDSMAVEVPRTTQSDDPHYLEPGEVIPIPRPRPSRSHTSRQSLHVSAAANIFDEIQSLAEGLQSELAEYKAKLGKERVRIQELESKKLELEFINHSLKHQVEKYENIKDAWEAGELNNRSRIDELTREKDMLEEKVTEILTKVEELQESELGLKEKVAHMEQEKLQWKEEQRKYEVTIDGFSTLLKDEQSKRTEVEDKIKELEAQMDTCYNSCESRMADTESMKETYEVKIQELTEQVGELVTKLDSMRRELETQKTLMDMMKKEHLEGQEKNKISNQEQDYIS